LSPSRSSSASREPVEAPDGHRGAPDGTVGGEHIGLDGGIATRIEDLAGADVDDFRHGQTSLNYLEGK
jgi:hypothetical protein